MQTKSASTKTYVNLRPGIKIPSKFEKYLIKGSSPKSLAIQLPNKSSKNFNDPSYYSSQHIAYKDGYTLEKRIEKYSTAISNTLKYMNILDGYVDLGGGLGYFAYGLAKEAIKNGVIKKKDVPTLFYSYDQTNIQTDPKITGLGITMTQGSLDKIPYPDNFFSAATCFHVMEHIYPELLDRSISEMYRVMRKHSLLYLIIPTLEGRIQKDEETYEQIVFDKTHITIGTRSWWKERFSKANFVNMPDLENKFDQKNYGWVFVFKK
jgi:ubiquinone/menaquinone biosynthesis C-methylase UbiE